MSFLRGNLVAIGSVALLAAGCADLLGIGDFTDQGAGGTAGSPSTGGGGEGGATACEVGDVEACYEGPAAARGQGACLEGSRSCLPTGLFGSCEGDVLPTAADDCMANVDTNCDGELTCSCSPGSNIPCYDGPQGTEINMPCRAGMRQCNQAGTAYGACQGQVLPKPIETCIDGVDDNCNGTPDEGCVCQPNTTETCYNGPSGTQGVGVCVGGVRICNSSGTTWGPCNGEVVPSTEDCQAMGDEDCSGQACADALWSVIWKQSQQASTRLVTSTVLDPNGNLIVAGHVEAGSGAALDCVELTLTPPGVLDFGFVVKVDPSGAALWGKTFNTSSPPVSVGTDTSGNIYVGGTYANATTIDGVSLTASGFRSGYLAKFTPAGTISWARSYGGGGTVVMNAVAASSFNMVFIGGAFAGVTEFGTGAGTKEDAFVARVSPSDGSLTWTQTFPDTLNNVQRVHVLASDQGGNVYATGTFGGEIRIGTTTYPAAGGTDVFVARMTSNGSLDAAWPRMIQSPGNDYVRDIALDSSGAPIVVGTLGGGASLGGSLPLNTQGVSDAFIARYSLTNTHLYSKVFGSTSTVNNADEAHGVSVDALGNAILCGTFGGSVSFGGPSFSTADARTVFLLKLDTAGNHVWSKAIDGMGQQIEPRCVASKVNNQVTLGFFNGGTVDVGTGPLTNAGNDSAVIARFQP